MQALHPRACPDPPSPHEGTDVTLFSHLERLRTRIFAGDNQACYIERTEEGM